MCDNLPIPRPQNHDHCGQASSIPMKRTCYNDGGRAVAMPLCSIVKSVRWDILEPKPWYEPTLPICASILNKPVTITHAKNELLPARPVHYAGFWHAHPAI